jgi:AMP-binding enzyme
MHSRPDRNDMPLDSTAPAVLAASLARHATVAPYGEALRHKHRGVWRSWSWADVATGTARVAEILHGHGVTAGSTVALAGAYAPGLLLTGLAALRLGAHVRAVPTALDPAALALWLRAHRPVLALLSARDQFAPWLAARAEAGWPVVILAEIHPLWRDLTHQGLLSAAALFVPPTGRRLTPHPILWAEESTDWEGGLSPLLAALVAGDRTLAFPETPQAAERDRAEVQPHAVLLSTAGLRRLHDDVHARLPTGSGPAARLVASALAARRPNPFQLWLLGRVRRPIGLGRLRDVALTEPGIGREEGGADLLRALGLGTPEGAAPGVLVAA